MNTEEKEAYFDAFIEEYKDKSLKEKQTILVKELKELIALSQKICLDKGITYELITNKEILDINKDNYTEDDYVEAIYVYLQTFKEILSTYLMPEYEFEE